MTSDASPLPGPPPRSGLEDAGVSSGSSNHDSDDGSTGPVFDAPEPHATLPLRQTTIAGPGVHVGLLFRSRQWWDPLRADVRDLIEEFKRRRTGRDRGGDEQDARQMRMRDEDEGLSPYGVFKQAWVHMGWGKVHVLGCVDAGQMRMVWSDTIGRAFLGELRTAAAGCGSM